LTGTRASAGWREQPLDRQAGGAHPWHADLPHPLVLLRTRRDRPRSHSAAEQYDELAAFHVWMAAAWQEKM